MIGILPQTGQQMADHVLILPRIIQLFLMQYVNLDLSSASMTLNCLTTSGDFKIWSCDNKWRFDYQ